MNLICNDEPLVMRRLGFSIWYFEEPSGGVDQLLPRLPCLHHFHLHCIIPWLEKNRLCPVCRYPMPTNQLVFSILRGTAICLLKPFHFPALLLVTLTGGDHYKLLLQQCTLKLIVCKLKNEGFSSVLLLNFSLFDFLTQLHQGAFITSTRWHCV